MMSKIVQLDSRRGPDGRIDAEMRREFIEAGWTPAEVDQAIRRRMESMDKLVRSQPPASP